MLLYSLPPQPSPTSRFCPRSRFEFLNDDNIIMFTDCVCIRITHWPMDSNFCSSSPFTTARRPTALASKHTAGIYTGPVGLNGKVSGEEGKEYLKFLARTVNTTLLATVLYCGRTATIATTTSSTA